MADTQHTAITAGELIREMRRVLEFWERVSWDPGKQVFLTLGCDNRPLASGIRSGVLIARVLWAYSAAFNLTGEEHYLDLANRAYQDLSQNYIDNTYGGIFEQLTTEGKPLRTDKIIYTQSYSIYGLSEYYLASGNTEALEKSVLLSVC